MWGLVEKGACAKAGDSPTPRVPPRTPRDVSCHNGRQNCPRPYAQDSGAWNVSVPPTLTFEDAHIVQVVYGREVISLSVLNCRWGWLTVPRRSNQPSAVQVFPRNQMKVPALGPKLPTTDLRGRSPRIMQTYLGCSLGRFDLETRTEFCAGWGWPKRSPTSACQSG